MTINYNFLFYYLEKEEIIIDKEEFIYQIQSHSDYPSLLSIADTLSFFSIDNGAIRIDFTDLELLPNRFIVLLNKGKKKDELYYIEQKDNKYYVLDHTKNEEISLNDLEKNWKGIVLLIKKSEIETSNKHKNKYAWLLPTLSLIIFIFTLIKLESSLVTKIFFIFPTIGILFSVAALKDLFGAKSELINNFCNLTTSTSCSTIVNSDKWGFFSYINFSDLAIVFFSSQFFGLLVLLIAGNSTVFFSIQFVLLFGSIPIILLSLYFQKFVEKKWCPICLVIISLIILEFIFCILTFDISFSFTRMSLLLLGLVSLFVSLVWFQLKNLLSEHKDLKESQLKSNRFIRNYEIFKNTLISKDKAELPFANIVLGNKESKTILTLITSPFCSYCKEVHEIMERILDKNGNDLQIKLIIKVDLNSLDEDRKLFLRSLMHIYFNESVENFRNKMNYWYENKNIKKWLDYNQVKDFSFSKIDSIYNSQNAFCTNSGNNYTPAIFINGYEYPKLYERKHLEFFINDLIEDNF